MSDELRAVARTFRQSLPATGEVSVIQLGGLDRTGIPVVQANLLSPGTPVVTGHGYGFAPIEGEVGALGELCEEVHCADWVARHPGVASSFDELVRTRGARAVIDPMTLCLPAGAGYTGDTVLRWVEARRWPGGEPVLIPDEWIASHNFDLPPGERLITPITNGLGAGLDLEHAIGHGIMELLQRDGNVVGFRALDQGVVIDLDAVRDEPVRALLAHLRELGIDVTAKLASTEFGITNLYVVGNDRGMPASPLQVTACGEAAHPDKHRALRKALLEFCGSRARKVGTHGEPEMLRRVMPAEHVERQLAAVQLDQEEPRALHAMAEWLDQDAATLRGRLSDTVFSHKRTVRFSELPDAAAEQVATSAARLTLLLERLAAQGMEPVVVDCSPAGGPVRAVKVVVPGLESETMSYGRIGRRGVERLRARGDALILDAPREGARRVLLRPEDEERAGGPAWFDAVLADRIVGSLYPLYRETGCFSAQLLRQQRRTAEGQQSRAATKEMEDAS
ncbi:YcaO-like family protein [Rhizosaccharibacter radicis]|uniref:YcaO-like family protein n=1 Tax=Rhizosaccharibacter radicis TaxID=2782605 RepID=A0ABT1VUY8_9PROT|nr:YcaO-like family protein [Acetobacteraceae bacterium KSS12]